MSRLRLARLLVGLLAGSGLLAGAGKLLLATEFAARQVVARLRAAVGAPVRVGGVDLGYASSSLRDLEVMEKESSAEPPCWTSCRAVDADLSLWQLLRGSTSDGAVLL